MEQERFDAALAAALQTGESAPEQEKAALKAALARRADEPARASRRVSLWWLPMTANLVVCGVPAFLFSLPVMPLAAHLAAFAFGWLAVGGVVMTLVGLRCSDLKKQLTFELPRRGQRKERAL